MELIKAGTTDLTTSEMITVRFLGHQKLFPVQDIQNLPDIVKRDVLYPKLNDKTVITKGKTIIIEGKTITTNDITIGSVEREKVTKRLISMLQIKFDVKPKDAHPEELSPQEMVMAEFGSFIRQYSLTGEEVLEAYRMGVRKQLMDVRGEIIQIYPNLSIIQAGEVLNAYMEHRTENHQHTNGIEKLKALANPDKQTSPEEAKENKKRLLQKIVVAIEENKPCEHSFLFFEYVVKKGGLKGFLENKDAQKIVIYKKMKQVLESEKRKKKSVFFNPYELNQLSGFFQSNSDEMQVELKFSFERLQAMAITQVKNDLVYNWVKKQIKKNNK